MNEVIVLDTNLLYDYLDIKLDNTTPNTKTLMVENFVDFMESKDYMKGYHVGTLYELFGRIYNAAFSFHEGDLKKVYYTTKKRLKAAIKILETKNYNIKMLNDSYFTYEMNPNLNAEEYCKKNMDRKSSFEKQELARVLLFLVAHYSFYYLDENDEIDLLSFRVFIEKIKKNISSNLNNLLDNFYSHHITMKKLNNEISYILGAQLEFVRFVFKEKLVYPYGNMTSNLMKINNYVFKENLDGITQIRNEKGKGVPKNQVEKKISMFFEGVQDLAIDNGKAGFNSVEIEYFEYLFQSIQSNGRKINKNDAIDFVIATSFEKGSVKRREYGIMYNYTTSYVTNDKFVRNFLQSHDVYNEEIHNFIFQI
ncbi:hypothetical protein ACOMCU_15910 [Lysinibacillus sp. UGB7]|uniref:hypothetical protein n=1 Tax=Lysinibacillus sp. UGB7 TaxID=3411039 RepID=UPI003B760051